MAKNKLLEDSISKAFDSSELIKHINKVAKSEISSIYSDDDVGNITGYISTGNVVLDILMSNEHWYTYKGGIPLGRISEIAGTESCVTGDTIIDISLFDDKENKWKNRRISILEFIEDFEEYISLRKAKVLTPYGYQFVKRSIYKGTLPTYFLKLENGKILKGSAEHLVRIHEDGEFKWRFLKEAYIGTTVECDNGFSKVEKNDLLREQEKIYDIEVDHPVHAYYTNGIVSHNTGKTAIALSISEQVLKNGGIVIYFDAERAIEKKFASRLAGLKSNGDRFFIIEPNTMEQVYEICSETTPKAREMIGVGKPILIVWDSMSATPTSQEMDKIGFNPQESIGHAARTNSLGLKKINSIIKNEQISFVILNQLKHLVPAPMFGEKYTTSGGKALGYYATLRIWLSKKGKLQIDNEMKRKIVIGSEIEARIKKSRLGSEGQRGVVPFYYDKGFDEAEAIFNMFREGAILKGTRKDTLNFDKDFVSGIDQNFYDKYEKTIFSLKNFSELYNGEQEFKDCVHNILAKYLIIPFSNMEGKEVIYEEEKE